MIKFARLIVASVAISGLAGCTAVPGSGPLTSAVGTETTNKADHQNYSVLPLNTAILSYLRNYQFNGIPDSFKGKLGNRQSMTIGAGDGLAVNIWEAAPTGCFRQRRKRAQLFNLSWTSEEWSSFPMSDRYTLRDKPQNPYADR